MPDEDIYEKPPAERKKKDEVKEIELTSAPNIFQADENSLKHELICSSKARSIVDALKRLKSQF